MGCWHWDLNLGQLPGYASGHVQMNLGEEVCAGGPDPVDPLCLDPLDVVVNMVGRVGLGWGEPLRSQLGSQLEVGCGGDSLGQHGRGWSVTRRQGTWTAVMGQGSGPAWGRGDLA